MVLAYLNKGQFFGEMGLFVESDRRVRAAKPAAGPWPGRSTNSLPPAGPDVRLPDL